MKPNKDITWFCSLFVIVYGVLLGILKRMLIVIILKNRKLVRVRQQQDQQTGTKLCTDIINLKILPYCSFLLVDSRQIVFFIWTRHLRCSVLDCD